MSDNQRDVLCKGRCLSLSALGESEMLKPLQSKGAESITFRACRVRYVWCLFYSHFVGHVVHDNDVYAGLACAFAVELPAFDVEHLEPVGAVYFYLSVFY